VANVRAKAHVAVQQLDLRWSDNMSDFGPALGLYLLTAAASITLALSWVG
jgi:hypothetical protein